jgi:broad specificity phosphatase PhoE
MSLFQQPASANGNSLLTASRSNRLEQAGTSHGTAQVPLDADGIKQIQKIAPLIAPLELDGIYTSPLRRAVQNARVVADGTNLPIRKAKD